MGAEAPSAGTGFEVRLEHFTGPFDLLLGLIAQRQLDITVIALAQVTDEFIGYIRRLRESGTDWALDEASEFVLIAATLLDLKAARLLPAGEVEDEEDIALLEARDLLFARLLQYRAFKEVTALIDDTLKREAGRFARQVSLEPAFAALLPELVWTATPEDLAALAARVLAPREPKPTEVGMEHLHTSTVSVREQAALLGRRLQAEGTLSFRQLIADAGELPVAVARFLALLEMFRDSVVAFEQAAPLAELTVRWTAVHTEWTADTLTEDYDGAAAAGAREGMDGSG